MCGDITTIRRVVLLGLALLAAVAGSSRGKVIYVDDDANGLGNGDSWQNACKYLQDALAAAKASEKPVEIRVAQGVYTPDRSTVNPGGTGDRTATFQMLSGVALMGGFAGLGAFDANDRDIAKYETILSGDLAGNDVLSEDPEDAVFAPEDGYWANQEQWSLVHESTRRENSLHVVTSSGVDETAVLDGVTVTAGNAFKPPYWPGGYPGDADDRGGGIANEGGSPRLIGCTLINNSAWHLGGGMYSVRACRPILEDCHFVGNFTLRDAGALCNGYAAKDMSGVQTEMTRCTFEANVAWGRGSAIFGYGSTLGVTGCQFTSNAGRGFFSAAVVNNGVDSTFDHCVFSDNQSMAVEHNDARLILTDCVFTDHVGRGLRLMPYRDVTVERCTFIRNQGGAIDGGGGSWNIKGCVFRENSTTGTGGAINYGGDIYNPACRLTLERCVFAGNVGTDGGGAVYNARIGPDITNCTFVGNRSLRGGALLIAHKGSANLRNCILWANQAQEGPSVCLVDDSQFPSMASISYSLVGGGLASIWQGPVGTVHWGQGNIDVDPCFAQMGYWDPNGTLDVSQDDLFVPGDYHLQSQAGRWDPATQSWVVDGITSPCIDAGDPKDPIGLEPFPNGGRINAGAYGGTAEASKSYFGGPACRTIIAGDINGDCRVDFEDFEILIQHWLEQSHVVAPPTSPGGIPER